MQPPKMGWRGNGWYKHKKRKDDLDRIDHYWKATGEGEVMRICGGFPAKPFILSNISKISFLQCKACKEVLKKMKAREKSIRRFADKGADWL